MDKNLKVIPKELTGNISVEKSFSNTYSGLKTKTAKITVDNIDRTIAADVNLDMIPTKEDVKKNFSTKKDIEALNLKIESDLSDNKQDIIQEVKDDMAVFKTQLCSELQSILNGKY